ncbi:MAG TPA: indolepyruvate oxidoreductase subunit beta family protein [Burkholderiaceae bacterium]
MKKARAIHIAILALGGQGGGVLVDWIVALGMRAGWWAQATSVAGVAQRTGATIYYVELVERDGDKQPVMALMPAPGDVDIVIAAELMEAGRALQRGLVTRDRTLVLASSHRAYAVPEKSAPGDGVADGARVQALVRDGAKRLVIADMQALAARHGSVISASLFGALAGSGALPFDPEAFEQVVREAGVGVDASLAAVRAGAQLAREAAPASALAAIEPMQTAPRPLPERSASRVLQPLLERIRTTFPREAWDLLGEGLARVADYQDAAYAREYLDRVARLHAAGTAAGVHSAGTSAGGPEHGHALTIEAARWIAVAMSYDDVIRVADLKTRAERFARVRREVKAADDDVLATEEYFHPRLEEIAGLLPAGLAAWIGRRPALRAWLARRLDRGRRVQSNTVRGHLQLRAMAQLRRWRRGNARHQRERAHLDAWLAAVERALAVDYALAVEVLRCRRLIKGYSDTHARGSGRFDRLMRAAEWLRGDAASTGTSAQQLASLREAALRDAEGRALDERWRALQLPA